MPDRTFVDTNVLVYAYDNGAGIKHQQASALVQTLWERRTGVISTQVLQELHVNLRRKASRPVSRVDARSAATGPGHWRTLVEAP